MIPLVRPVLLPLRGRAERAATRCSREHQITIGARTESPSKARTGTARATAYFQGTTLGWGVLTATNVASRFGWNGWEFDSTIDLKYHVGSVTVSCELDVTLQQ